MMMRRKNLPLMLDIWKLCKNLCKTQSRADAEKKLQFCLKEYVLYTNAGERTTNTHLVVVVACSEGMFQPNL